MTICATLLIMGTQQQAVRLKHRNIDIPLDSTSHKSSASRGFFWTMFAAVWLQIVVLIFIVIQLSRLNTPVGAWLSKTLDLILKS